MKNRSTPFREEFARFLENPSREGLREVIKNHHGELSDLDFKAQLPEPAKLAKHILGMANSGGGCLIAGVSENDDGSIEPKGLVKLEDKADIDNSIRKFLPQTLMENLSILDFSYPASEYPKLVGKTFQILIVSDNPAHLPVLSLVDGNDIRATTIYVRRHAATTEANHEEFQGVINRRIESGHSTRQEVSLEKHLQDLKTLYSHLERHRLLNPIESIFGMAGVAMRPMETHGMFLTRMLEEKKKYIAKLLAE